MEIHRRPRANGIRCARVMSQASLGVRWLCILAYMHATLELPKRVDATIKKTQFVIGTAPTGTSTKYLFPSITCGVYAVSTVKFAAKPTDNNTARRSSSKNAVLKGSIVMKVRKEASILA